MDQNFYFYIQLLILSYEVGFFVPFNKGSGRSNYNLNYYLFNLIYGHLKLNLCGLSLFAKLIEVYFHAQEYFFKFSVFVKPAKSYLSSVV